MAALGSLAEWQRFFRSEAKPPCATRAVQGQLPTQTWSFTGPASNGDFYRDVPSATLRADRQQRGIGFGRSLALKVLQKADVERI